MSSLLSCQDLTKAFNRTLFESISLGIHEGEKVGLIGPNGAGKSTLLRIMAGREAPDAGQCILRKGLRLGFVAQVPELPEEETIQQAVEQAAHGRHGERYEEAAAVSIALGSCGFEDTDLPLSALSGGWRKRAAIAIELAKGPELLLLDEPTNHLDIESVAWLEDLLKRADFTYLVVTHDRYFLERAANRVIELNRLFPGGFFSVSGPYSQFLEKRAEAVASQMKLQESLRLQAANELEWLRRGPKARRTKANYRIKAAGELFEEYDEVRSRNRVDTAAVGFQATNRQTKRLLVAENISRSLGGQLLFQDVSVILSPGTRIGIVGPNGCGKSTLLRALTGESPPDSGRVRPADGLRIVYFDQGRGSLDPDQTLQETLATHGDKVVVEDKGIHVISWAKRFNFEPEQLKSPIRLLSGGEQSRALIAKLFLKPADLLVLDEPTNDLDIPTLRTLEQNLADFPGALLLVSHDRFFLDQVCTEVLGFTTGGAVHKFGDYQQWADHQRSAEAKPARAPAKEPEKKPKPKRLTYMEQKEFEGMEEAILEAETALEELEAVLADPANAADAKKLAETHKEAEAARQQVQRLYARWAELEAKVAESGS